jgi:hypothetical protein
MLDVGTQGLTVFLGASFHILDWCWPLVGGSKFTDELPRQIAPAADGIFG